ncbi:helix-turn-helix domain-containing protein [Lysinibacillus xylanilyticus]|uniref:Helix-turn-helix domain-containing protein n=1 Tax=Lysinibacillus xylanilyticus TaxID=582475 RepID=A0ABT4EMA1_9BACI|nr:helix-turn-helix domain-containing protein [Lysinibacillus xylanilyticus]MCY9546795.1 helix-turn-helix domain-containing protein [Lysinibacillus xylanilyticus]
MTKKLPDADSPLFKIMDTAEASELWGLTQQHIKLLCTKGEVICRKIGRVWLLEKDQPNPRKYESHI